MPKVMLGLSDEQIQTVQFVFWLCHIVERELSNVLEQSVRQTAEILGVTPKEEDDFIRENYAIKFEKVDPGHPKYGARSITFNNRIDLVERLRGRTAHTKFLRKIKDIRNSLSHGRINDLSYNGKNLASTDTKREVIFDYVRQALYVDEEKEGGAIGALSEVERQRVEDLWSEWKRRQPSQ